ncbi:MAG TPA: hypothetical protein VIL84_07970 [Devosiaceae bacterium]
MSRIVPVVSTAVLSLALAGAAHAADYMNGMRGSLPPSWTNEDNGLDPVGIEMGLRYWYSMGSQSLNTTAGDFTSTDKTHILEGHLRIDDYSTNTFATANVGYSVAISGDYDTPSGTGSVAGGQVGYAGADLGWMAFGDPNNGLGIGALAGYQYWNDSPDMGRVDYYNIGSASDVTWSSADGSYSVTGASVANNVDIHTLRLGIAARANLGFMDIDGYLAAIPFAKVTGTIGAAGFSPVVLNATDTLYPTSPVSIDGMAYGAAAQLMVGFHPTDNLTLRLGARAQYLTGSTNATYSTAVVTAPQDVNPPDGTYEPPTVATQSYIETNRPFEIMRLGALAELSWAF